MKRKLEITIIGKNTPKHTPIFSRKNAIWQEENDIIVLQHKVNRLVDKVKKFSGDKKELANTEIEKLVKSHSFLNNAFDNLEGSIRELARELW